MASVAAPAAEDVERYWRDGYIALPHVALEEELEEVRALLDPLYDRLDSLPKAQVKELSGTASRSITEISYPTRFEPRLLETAAFQRCRALAERLLGGPAKFTGDHSIYKAGGCPHNTAWHQDQFYNGHALWEEIVSIWLPLHKVDDDSGCMRFIPGSHRTGLLNHRKLSPDPEVHGVTAVGVDGDAAVACPLPAGGATVHQQLTIHSTGPNRGTDTRRAWIVGFDRVKGARLRRAVRFAARRVNLLRGKYVLS